MQATTTIIIPTILVHLTTLIPIFKGPSNPLATSSVILPDLAKENNGSIDLV